MTNELPVNEPADLDAQIKQWVVRTSSITKPPDKRFTDGYYWSASITLGSDINGTGDTIERAYLDLTHKIATSAHYRALFIKLHTK